VLRFHKDEDETQPGRVQPDRRWFGTSVSLFPEIPVQEEQTYADYKEPIFSQGTSKRIFGELSKVIDSSDVIPHILDARDPMGTMRTTWGGTRVTTKSKLAGVCQKCAGDQMELLLLSVLQ
jgi:hypothetical protein